MNPTNTYLSIIAIIAALALIMTSIFVTPAFAIKRFYNCMTDIANKYAKLSIDDVNTCYGKEYHSGPFATHSHSTISGSSTSSTTSK